MKITLLVIAFLSLISCVSGTADSGMNFDDFRSQTKSIAGNNAIDCGHVGIGEKQIEANTCSANNFNNKSSFFSTYSRQGIDSRVATGIAYDKDSGLYFLHFDSDPSGGGKSDNGIISKDKCKTPSFSGSVDVDFGHLFSCN